MGWKKVNRRQGYERIKAISRGEKFLSSAKKDKLILASEYLEYDLKSAKRINARAKTAKQIKINLNYKNAKRIVSALMLFQDRLSESEKIFLESLKSKLSCGKASYLKGEIAISSDEVFLAFKLLKKISPRAAQLVLKNLGR